MKYLLITFAFLLSVVTSLLSVVASAQTHSKIVVVVPLDSSISMLNDVEVANIFLARTNRFPNGERSIPVEIKNNDAQTHFYQQISGKTPRQLLSYWTTLVFTGKGRPPKRYSDIEELKAVFASQQGLITYIDASQVTDKMKVVYTFP